MSGRDLKAELEARERKHFQEKRKSGAGDDGRHARVVPPLSAADDTEGTKRLRIEAPNPALSLVNPDLDAGAALDRRRRAADTRQMTTMRGAEGETRPRCGCEAVRCGGECAQASIESNDGSDHSDGDEDDEDDTEELMRELQKIKRERAEEAARKACLAVVCARHLVTRRTGGCGDRRGRPHPPREHHERQPAAQPGQEHRVLREAPVRCWLSRVCGSRGRSWDDDVVFKNCARQDKPKTREFVNDSLRTDFHRKFMSKYIK